MKQTTSCVCVLALATACASQSPIDQAPRGTAVVVPESANCSFSPRYSEGQNCCVLKPYFTALAVDQAYQAAVSTFGFSPVPAPYDTEAQAYPELDHGHVHQALRGQRYELGGIVVPVDNVVLFRGLWLGLTLERAPAGRTEVRPSYCQHAGQSMVRQEDWHRAVQQSIYQSLPPDKKPR